MQLLFEPDLDCLPPVRFPYYQKRGFRGILTNAENPL